MLINHGGTNGDVLVIQNLFFLFGKSVSLLCFIRRSVSFPMICSMQKVQDARGDKQRIMQYSFILPLPFRSKQRIGLHS